MNPIRIQAEEEYAEGVITREEYFERARPYMSQEEIDTWLLENKNTFDLKEQKVRKFDFQHSEKEIAKRKKKLEENCELSGKLYEKYKHFGSQKLHDLLTPD